MPSSVLLKRETTADDCLSFFWSEDSDRSALKTSTYSVLSDYVIKVHNDDYIVHSKLYRENFYLNIHPDSSLNGHNIKQNLGGRVNVF